MSQDEQNDNDVAGDYSDDNEAIPADIPLRLWKRWYPMETSHTKSTVACDTDTYEKYHMP